MMRMSIATLLIKHRNVLSTRSVASKTSPNKSIKDQPCSKIASLASRVKLLRVLICSQRIPFGTGRSRSIPNNFTFSGSPRQCLKTDLKTPTTLLTAAMS